LRKQVFTTVKDRCCFCWQWHDEPTAEEIAEALAGQGAVGVG
jgi:hypothetical protein